MYICTKFPCMKTQSKFVLVKQGGYQYIYIYYKYKDKLIRINTGNKYISKGMTKELLYNSSVPDYDISNHKTRVLKKKVDDYISYRLIYGWRQLSKEECMSFVESSFDSVMSFINQKRQMGIQDLPEIKPKSFIDYLERFYLYKKDELNDRSSYKDYLTLVNSLKDFQKYFSTELSFEMMNTEEFMVKYRNFLSVNRGKDYKKDGYKTRGGLNDNTINKRFSGLKTFFLWVENRDLFRFRKVIHSFNVPKYDNDIVVLDKEDITKLLNLEIENTTWLKMRDVFVCNCFMGLRFSDLNTLKKSDFIIDEDGDFILFKENKKTNTNVQIPIQSTPLKILNKYEFNLPKFSHQFFNREIKKLFKEKELFTEPVLKKRRVNKYNEDKDYHRYELLTIHSCRRTFITLGISNNVPLNSLMLSSGHRKIQTLQRYMKKVQDKESFKRIDLDPPKTESNI